MKKVFFTALLVVFCTITALARPAKPGILYALMEDGSSVAYRLVGDEFSHACITLDGRHIKRVSDLEPDAPFTDQELWRYVEAPETTETSEADEAQLAPLRRAAQDNRYTDFPTLGEMHGLVLLVEYQDVFFQDEHDQALFDRQLNQPGYSENDGTGSARDYFIDQSMGQFIPYFDVVGPIRLPQKMAYYGGNSFGTDRNAGKMVTHACDLAHDSLGVDFSQYDYDNDGYLDFVFLIYAGYGENYGASSNTIWPHMSWLEKQGINYSQDGKKFDIYACSCELNGRSGTQIDGIGALCHEFSHVLGLPDAYNTRNSGNTQLGEWDCLDAGSYNNDSRTPPSYTAFERHQVGWLQFIDLVEPADSIVVPELTQSNVAYRIKTIDNPENEFFTLENHQQVGWDAPQSGRGLMIIHVDYNKSLWDSDDINVSSSHPHYDIEEADGTQGRNYETDLFPTAKNNAFTDETKPNMLSWSKKPTSAGITKITQNADGTVSFRFMNQRLSRPELLPANEITDTSFRAEWNAVEGSVAYSIHLQEVLPDSINPLILSENFALMEKGEYPQANNKDIASEIETYTHDSGWSAKNVYSCGGMVRVGSFPSSGSLTTPKLSASADTVTVLLRRSAYTGKTVNYTVALLDAQGNELEVQTYQADEEMQAPLVFFGNLPEVFRIKVASQKERLFIDDFRVANGVIDSLTISTAGNQEWDIYCALDAPEAYYDEAAGIFGYTLMDLVPSRTYTYYVTALNDDDACHSFASDSQTVTLLDQVVGIQQVAAPRDVISIHDLQGRCIGHERSALTQGFYIINGQKTVIR